MRSFFATPFFIIAWATGVISVFFMVFACTVQGIDIADYLEEKKKGLGL